jgi:hypothetical protein
MMNIFNKIRLFRSYRRSLRENYVRLTGDFNIKIDRASRLYTIINIPEDLFEDAYNIRKQDIEAISQTYVRDYINKLSGYLNSIGLSEIYDFYEPVKRVDKYSYLVVIGFKPFNSVKYNTIIYLRLIPIGIIILLTSLIISLIKII